MWKRSHLMAAVGRRVCASLTAQHGAPREALSARSHRTSSTAGCWPKRTFRPLLPKASLPIATAAVGERHIRLLAPLAFLSPHIIAVIADGTAVPIGNQIRT